jgi:hypothetical protein
MWVKTPTALLSMPPRSFCNNTQYANMPTLPTFFGGLGLVLYDIIVMTFLQDSSMIMVVDYYMTTWSGIKLAYIFQKLPKDTPKNVLDFYVILPLGTNEKYRESLYCFTHSARLPIYPSIFFNVTDELP